jgi:DNA/RNA-binding domain of Phe-tRNA-synthetase-like protein
LIQKSEEKIKNKNFDDIFRAYRELWWHYSMDPTKLRPSGEALVKRALKGNPLYSINNAVDAMNLISLESGLSTALHDLDKIVFPITIRRAKKGEIFKAIGTKSDRILSGNELVVVDKEKIIDLGFSTSSCDQSKITRETKKLLFIIYAPGQIESSYINSYLEKGLNLVAKYTKGNITKKGVTNNV